MAEGSGGYSVPLRLRVRSGGPGSPRRIMAEVGCLDNAGEGEMKLGEREEVVLVGCYTEAIAHAPYAGGPGVLTLGVTESSVREIARSGVSETGANPSYLAVRVGENGNVVVYAVNEREEGWVTRMKLEKDGRLKRTGRARVGKLPAHVETIGETGVVVGCFGDGSVWSIRDEGEMRVVDSVRMEDIYGGPSGVHQVLVLREQREQGEGKVLAVDPKGDRVTVLERNMSGKMRVGRGVRFETGSYPRHAAEDVAGVVHVALAKKRAVARVRLDECKEVGREAVGEGGGVLGAIRCVGGGVYVSDRGGRDGIWRVDGDWVGSGGAVPRDFAAGERAVVAVHQADGMVCVGGWGALDGGSALSGCAIAGAHSAPVCAAFVPRL